MREHATMRDMPSDRLPTVSGRVLPATVERLDRIAAELARKRPGEVVKRSDALRVALERGVEVLEHELGLVAEERAPKRQPAGKSDQRRRSKRPADPNDPDPHRR